MVKSQAIFEGEITVHLGDDDATRWENNQEYG